MPALRCLNCLIRREEEEANLTLLYSYIARKNDIPVALGKGCTRLADKCCALSHKWWFLTGTKPAFEAYRRSYCSYCTDLGTEVNIGDFHVDDDVLSMLPSWARVQLRVHEDEFPYCHFDNDIDAGDAVFGDAPPVFEADVAPEEEVPHVAAGLGLVLTPGVAQQFAGRAKERNIIRA